MFVGAGLRAMFVRHAMDVCRHVAVYVLLLRVVVLGCMSGCMSHVCATRGCACVCACRVCVCARVGGQMHACMYAMHASM